MALRFLLVVVAVMGWLAAMGGRASAHDSHAPAGSPHNWLPNETWVHRHWIPFDEQALKIALGLRALDLHAYLYDDHHVLADLARRRGLDPETLADRLVAPWQGISQKQRSLLRGRALRILTQGHLAQHMFFHVFHGLHLRHVSEDIFGMPSPAYRALRQGGDSYVEIAARGGVPVSHMRSGIVSLLVADHDGGIRRLEAWPAESDRILARTLALMSCWLRRPPAGSDPANPYGKNRFLHGSHAAGWPATASEQRADERRVERFRQRLRKFCWPHPPRWSWAAHPPTAPTASSSVRTHRQRTTSHEARE